MLSRSRQVRGRGRNPLPSLILHNDDTNNTIVDRNYKRLKQKGDFSLIGVRQKMKSNNENSHDHPHHNKFVAVHVSANHRHAKSGISCSHCMLISWLWWRWRMEVVTKKIYVSQEVGSLTKTGIWIQTMMFPNLNRGVFVHKPKQSTSTAFNFNLSSC